MSLGKISSSSGLSRAFRNNKPHHFIHLEEQHVCMIDLVGDTWVYSWQQPSQLYSNVLQEKKEGNLNNDPFFNTSCTTFPYEAYWTKVNCSHIFKQGDTRHCSFVSMWFECSSSWKNMLWPFYLLHSTGYKFEEVPFFLLYYYIEVGCFYSFFLSFSYTVYGNKLYHLTVFEMNVLTQETGTGFIQWLLWS